MMTNSKTQSEGASHSMQIVRLLDLIEGTNRDIEIGLERKDAFMVRQYVHLKGKYVSELIELLSKYQLTVHIKEAEIKEAA